MTGHTPFLGTAPRDTAQKGIPQAALQVSSTVCFYSQRGGFVYKQEARMQMKGWLYQAKHHLPNTGHSSLCQATREVLPFGHLGGHDCRVTQNSPKPMRAKVRSFETMLAGTEPSGA